MNPARDRTVAMLRIRNEERWIGRNLARTFQVCRAVVLWDDGSNDRTVEVCQETLHRLYGGLPVPRLQPFGWLVAYQNGTELHYLRSPFRPAVKKILEVSEIRDKQTLWEYVKARLDFDHVVCLDGDETMSKPLVKNFAAVIRYLEGDSELQSHDVLTVPFIYLWDSLRQRRIDGIYGDSPDGLPIFRVPRFFTIRRLSDLQLFSNRFEWEGQGAKALAGFHCGSIPQVNFKPEGKDWRGGTAPWPIIHFGYVEVADRRRKYEWYNRIDPGNKFEGEYRHLIGEPDIHAPGPVQLAPYYDCTCDAGVVIGDGPPRPCPEGDCPWRT